jgi:predicted Zn-dependent protease
MKNRKNTFIFFLLLILIPFFTNCATNPVTGEKEFMLLSEQMEIDWGNSVYPNAVWGEVGGGGRYYDPELEEYLAQTVKRLHSVSHRSNLPVDFIIQNSSVPNAWAIPGHVAMTRGLLANLENEAQFAFVMGHEMGHVAARHSAAQMSRSILIQAGLIAAGIALQDKGDADWILGAGAIGANLFLLKYSRDQELQADRLGALYSAKAGYDPHESINAHRRLDQVVDEYLQRTGKQSREASFLDELLSTHPPTEDRIRTINDTIKTMPLYPRSGDGVNSYNFQRMITRIKHADRAYQYYDLALKQYREDRIQDAENNLATALQADPKQAPFYNLRGLILIRKSDNHMALRNFAKAMELDRNYQPVYHSIGFAYYLEKNYSGALSYLRKSLELYPGNMPSHYFAGMSYYKLKDYEKAIAHLEPFASANSNHDRVYGILGYCYEQAGNQEAAYQSYKKQIAVDPNNKVGVFAAERVKTLEPAIQKKQEEQEQEKKKKKKK